MIKYTLNGKWFKSDDEMTNLGEYNFTQTTSLNLHHLKEKMDVHIPFSIFSSEKQKLR